MGLLISSFFTDNGVPKIGLTPKIRIWDVTGSLYNLVIGSPNGSSSITDGIMTEVTDAPSQDGFYTFDFTTALGYNQTKDYVVRVDGGTTLNNSERYQSMVITPDALDQPAASHNIAGTIGATINDTNNDTNNLVIDMNSVQAMLELLLKYDANRTKIDPVAKTLTVYNDDCTTPLRVFNLYDSTGTPSVTEVCERRPVSASDGLPVCP